MKIEYFNLYTHFVLTTFHRQPIIPEKNRERIEKYITGIINNYRCKLYAIFANPEHVHILVSRSPKISEEYLANAIAVGSTEFINKNKLSIGRFEWQETASAFSVSKGDIDNVCKYILNQKEHHKKETFQEEYNRLIVYYEQTLLKDKR